MTAENGKGRSVKRMEVRAFNTGSWCREVYSREGFG